MGRRSERGPSGGVADATNPEETWGSLCGAVERHANIPGLYSVGSLVTVVRFRMGHSLQSVESSHIHRATLGFNDFMFIEKYISMDSR